MSQEVSQVRMSEDGGGTRVLARVALLIVGMCQMAATQLVTPLCDVVSTCVSGPSTCGEWSGPFTISTGTNCYSSLAQEGEVYAASLLPTGDLAGHVLIWRDVRRTDPPCPPDQLNTYLIDPATATTTPTCEFQALVSACEIGCAGMTFLGAGSLFAAGGHAPNHVCLGERPCESGANIGDFSSPCTNVFSPTTGQWSAVADMNLCRHYPTSTYIPAAASSTRSASVVSIGGGAFGNESFEIWNEAANTWALYDASNPPGSPLPKPSNLKVHDYPWAFLIGAMDGEVEGAAVFYPNKTQGGSLTNISTWLLKGVPDAPYYQQSATRTGGPRAWGSAVIQYRLADGGAPRVILLGGGFAAAECPSIGTQFILAKNTVEYVVDPAGGGAWSTPQSVLLFPRVYHDTVALPDGKLVLIGGSQKINIGEDGLPLECWPSAPDCCANFPSVLVRDAEIYDPATNSSTLMAAQATGRVYHTQGLLLPDGRVISLGGEGVQFDDGLSLSCWDSDDGDQPEDIEFFSPPYMFKHPSGSQRPRVITVESPASVGEEISLTATVPAGTVLAKVTLTRPGTATHNWDADQRYLELPFTIDGYTINPAGETVAAVTASLPDSPYALPTGFYMVWAVYRSGSVSTSLFLQVE